MTALDVQIVAYGDVEALRDCLASIEALEPAVVTVVDHLGNVPEDLGPVGEASVVVRRDTTNPGFGAGHNRALQEGSSPYVLLLNPDARADRDGIVRAVEHLVEHADVAAAQGQIVNVATGLPERSQGDELGPVHLVGRVLRLRRLLGVRAVRRVATGTRLLRDHVERVPEGPVAVASLAATSLVVRRAAMEEVDGFDASYFLYGEDLDLCRRLRRAGWTLVALPYLTATHVSGGSSATSWQRELQWWQGTLQFAARWWSGPSFALAFCAGCVVAVELAVRRPRAATRAFRGLLVRPVLLRRRPDAEVAPVR